MSELEDLIFDLKKFKDDNSIVFEQLIIFPDQLFSALGDLQEMIGMDKAKTYVVNQIKFILGQYLHQIEHTRTFCAGNYFDEHKLHTVISGPPGSGKTTLAHILANIWLSLGLVSSKTENSFDNMTEIEKKISFRYGNDCRNVCKKILELEKYINNMILILGETCEYIKIKRKKSLDDEITLMENENDVFIHLLTEMKEIMRLTEKKINVDKIEFIDKILTLDEITRQYKKKTNFLNLGKEKRSINKLKILDRTDLVGKFVGHTASKTKQTLDACLGGVVLIDEAYSLVNGSGDTFGSEALTVLNEYMTTHCKELIVIFAGYKEELDASIFSSQRGLERRIGCYLDLGNYSPSDLAKIFKSQLNKNGWTISSDINLEKFFNDKKENFENYGGDTEKFALDCKFAYNRQNFQKCLKNLSSIKELFPDKKIVKLVKPISLASSTPTEESGEIIEETTVSYDTGDTATSYDSNEETLETISDELSSLNIEEDTIINLVDLFRDKLKKSIEEIDVISKCNCCTVCGEKISDLDYITQKKRELGSSSTGSLNEMLTNFVNETNTDETSENVEQKQYRIIGLKEFEEAYEQFEENKKDKKEKCCFLPMYS